MSFSGRTPAKITGQTVVNDGFFPDIDLGDFQEVMRINSEYRLESIRNRIQEAIHNVNYDLQAKKVLWLAAITPETTLDKVTGDSIDNETRWVYFYKMAVYSCAKAQLLLDYASMNRRDKAENKGKEEIAKADYSADCARYISILKAADDVVIDNDQTAQLYELSDPIEVVSV